ncbi:AAA family ATPase [Haloferax sp. Atlit-4N]|uniref:Cdc6/Cdc18 family protein n=1 Tax=Haloferax sp. Atlit-4N TaxID=2077206 RepID=UPI000E21DEC7|nr:Cdc6/Cdc18 family protein [Haloferax sp. Atlit-4N]RDZ53099.1 AAA family ATPase [Haloferax sp. Atlit-4N]
MITDPRVFEDEYLPRELRHREGAVEELSRTFGAALDGKRADDVLITGPSGVGKTVLARHTLGKLEAFAAVDHAHIECLGTTTGEILRTALREHHVQVDVALNTPVEVLREQLREAVDQPYILVLDEADTLPNTEALEYITRVPKVSIVAICHDADRWLARAPSTVRQNITGPIKLERYGVNELSSILRARADQGLPRGAVTNNQLQTIADEVAGVARFGIQALRAAAELADERGRSSIHGPDINDSFERAQHRIRKSNLRSLPFHHHVLYALVHEAGELPASDLHTKYEEVSQDIYYGHDLTPIGKRSRRNKLAKLQEYDLIESEGPPQNRVYRVLDETIELPDSISALDPAEL